MLFSGIRWRKAVITSIVFHLFLGTVTGYLANRLFAAPPVLEQTIELEIAQELPADNLPPSAPDNQTPSAQSEPVIQPNETTPVIEQKKHVPIAVTPDALAISATELPAATSGNTGSSSSTVNSSNLNGSSGGGERGSIVPPRILSKKEPNYPLTARQSALQGTVIIKVQILENGRPGDIAVAKSSGHDILDNAAITAVKEWRFVPAKDRDSGRALVCYTTLPVSFRIN